MLEDVKAAGVKLIYLDSPASVPAAKFFKTCNLNAGKVAAQEMLKALIGKGLTSGNIGIVNVNAATDSVVQREAGFREVFDGSGFRILETEYGEGDAAKSQSIAESYIARGVVGIFGTNEGGTVGAGNAVKASGDNAVIVVGFDRSDTIMDLISDGWVLCTIAQKPYEMGYQGMQAAIGILNGTVEEDGEEIDVGVDVLFK
jgi:ribose transport system substrate-binding protein